MNSVAREYARRPALAWTYSRIVLTWPPYTEVDRAIDNLVKSGKLWAAPRRDSMPLMMGRPYPDYGMISRYLVA